MLKQDRFSVIKEFNTCTQESFCPQGTEPFIVKLVTNCVGIPPVESVVPLNILNPLVSFITTCAQAIGLLFVEFVTFTSKNHFTVILFLSAVAEVVTGAKATLLLLNETFVKVISVAFDVKTMSL